MRLRVVFYKTEAGKEPVRDWLKSLPTEEKKIIGQDIKTVQFGWPLGMPMVRKLEKDLWEVRSHLPNRIARVIFTVSDDVLIPIKSYRAKSHKVVPVRSLDKIISRQAA